jgi:hypothetical protein
MPDASVDSPASVQIQMRAVVFQEGDLWVAQCIEHDIRATAETLADLNGRLELVLLLECEESIKREGHPFKGIPRAPSDFEEMWNKQAGAFTPTSRVVSQKRGTSGNNDRVGLELALYA